MTDQTDQAENRAGPVNSADYGNGCLASNHFARQKTQEGSSLIQFHSYCQVSLALTGLGVSRQTDRDLAIDLLNCNESDSFPLFFCFVCKHLNMKEHTVERLTVHCEARARFYRADVTSTFTDSVATPAWWCWLFFMLC